MKTEKLSIRLAEPIRARVDALAVKEKRSRNQIVEICLEEHLPAMEHRAGILLSSAASEAASIPEEEHERLEKARKPRRK